MKTLKLDHELAELILRGEKKSTWRLYDDKDISVNDDVHLIDKVNPDDRTTWRPIGIAHVNAVIQKRLSDIDEKDMKDHERFSSEKEMLETYQRYYGSQVSLGTPVKVINFTFTPQGNSMEGYVDKSATILTELKLFADGGSRGNPGPSASGFAVMDMDEHIIVKQGIYLGVTTNNQAEYQALKLGLEEARRMQAQIVHVYMDSLLVVNQMSGSFKVKNRDLWPIHDAIKQLVKQFKRVTFTHVPREFNKIADSAVNEALDAHADLA